MIQHSFQWSYESILFKLMELHFVKICSHMNMDNCFWRVQRMVYGNISYLCPICFRCTTATQQIYALIVLYWCLLKKLTSYDYGKPRPGTEYIQNDSVSLCLSKCLKCTSGNKKYTLIVLYWTFFKIKGAIWGIECCCALLHSQS